MIVNSDINGILISTDHKIFCVTAYLLITMQELQPVLQRFFILKMLIRFQNRLLPYTNF